MIHQVEQVLIWRLILHVLSFYQLNDLNSRWLLTCDVPPPPVECINQYVHEQHIFCFTSSNDLFHFISLLLLLLYMLGVGTLPVQSLNNWLLTDPLLHSFFYTISMVDLFQEDFFLYALYHVGRLSFLVIKFRIVLFLAFLNFFKYLLLKPLLPKLCGC